MLLAVAEKERRLPKGRCQSQTRKGNQTASAILVDAKYADQRRTHLGSGCSLLQKQGVRTLAAGFVVEPEPKNGEDVAVRRRRFPQQDLSN